MCDPSSRGVFKDGGTVARLELVDELEALLNEELRAKDFVLLGRGLGDSIDGLPLEWVSEGEPRLGASFRYSEGKAEIQREGETEFSPYTPAEQFEDVLKHGGRVRLKPPTKQGVEALFTVTDGRITRAMLLGSCLRTLDCDTERDVLNKFGATEYRSHSYGFSRYCWPSRSITANRYEGKLFSVVLGEVDLKDSSFSAVDLLCLALQWNEEHPGLGWPLVPVSGSKSSRVQADRLLALLRAFGVAKASKKLLRKTTWSPPNPLKSFFDGDFLAGASPEQVERVSSYLADPKHGLPDQLERGESEAGPEDLRRFWQRMLRFRERVHAVTQFNSGVLEAGWGYFLLSVRVSGGIANKLSEDVDALDKALACFIDPDHRAIPWTRLVRDFEFPEEDYKKLCIEEC